MARTLVIANQKGGVGKSTSAMNLGVALAERGARVLLIDLDPQGGLSAAFGVDTFNARRSAYSLVCYPNTSLARVLRNVRDGLGLVPASVDLAAAEIQLAAAPDRAGRLRAALERSRIPFDYLLIDTPPGLGVLTANGLVAADEVLIPVQCQYLAMRGVRPLVESIDRLRATLNPGLRLGGLFDTMYRDEALQSHEVMDELRAVFGPQVFATVIDYAEAVAEAPVAGQSLLEYAPEHPVAQAYRALAEEIAHGRAE